MKIIAIGESHWIKKWCELYKIYHLGPSYEDIKSIVQYSIKWANKVVKMREILVKKHKKRGFLAFFKDRVHTPTLFYNTLYDLLYCVYIFMQFVNVPKAVNIERKRQRETKRDWIKYRNC